MIVLEYILNLLLTKYQSNTHPYTEMKGDKFDGLSSSRLQMALLFSSVPCDNI